MFTINKNTRKIFIIALSLVAIGMLGASILLFLFPGYESSQVTSLTCNGESNIEYSVTMTENPVYEEEVISDEKYYLKPFTVNIHLECSLDVVTDAEADIDYSGKVYGMLISEITNDDTKDIVWEKHYNYVDIEKENDTGQSAKLNQQVTIDLEEYEAITDSLINDYYILTDYYLKIYYENEVTVSKGDNTETEIVYTYIKIPFTDNVMEITNSSPESFSMSFENEVMVKKAINQNLILVFIMLFVASVVSLLIVLFRTKGIDMTDVFKNKKEKIFKEYGNRLAGLTDTLAYQSSVMISIDKIEDIIKIADEIGQTVFYYEVDEKDERKIEFYVFDEGRVYYLVIFGTLKG